MEALLTSSGGGMFHRAKATAGKALFLDLPSQNCWPQGSKADTFDWSKWDGLVPLRQDGSSDTLDLCHMLLEAGVPLSNKVFSCHFVPSEYDKQDPHR